MRMLARRCGGKNGVCSQRQEAGPSAVPMWRDAGFMRLPPALRALDLSNGRVACLQRMAWKMSWPSGPAARCPCRRRPLVIAQSSPPPPHTRPRGSSPSASPCSASSTSPASTLRSASSTTNC